MRTGVLHSTVIFFYSICITGIVLNGCAGKNNSQAVLGVVQFKIIDVKNLPAEIALQWYDLELKIIRRKPGFTPPVAARTIGYMGIVLYESLVKGMLEYRSLASQLNIPGIPLNRKSNCHWAISANAALAVAVKKFSGILSHSDIKEIESLEKYFNELYSKDISPEQFIESVNYGKYIADAIYSWSGNDGGQNGFQNNYGKYMREPLLPGMWQPTAFTGGLLPYWGRNRYLFTANSIDCQPPPPPVYSDEENSILFKEAMEVYTVFQHLTTEQADIAKFWADPSGSTFTPGGHSVKILCQVIKERKFMLDSAAIAFCKMGIALNDAFVSCWDTKYRYNFVRPITYIRKHFAKDWIPFLPTPNFPEYSSGHSVQSAAMAEVMTSLFGDNYSFTDNTNDTLGYRPRHYTSFRACANEAAVSRLYGGIHFPVSIKSGLLQGQKIGRKVNTINFRNEEQIAITDISY